MSNAQVVTEIWCLRRAVFERLDTLRSPDGLGGLRLGYNETSGRTLRSPNGLGGLRVGYNKTIGRTLRSPNDLGAGAGLLGVLMKTVAYHSLETWLVSRGADLFNRCSW